MSAIVCPYIPWTGKIYYGRPYCVITKRYISSQARTVCKNCYEECQCYIEARSKANYFDKIMKLYAKYNSEISADDDMKTILRFEKYVLEYGAHERKAVLRAYRMGTVICDALENTRYTTIDIFIKELYEKEIIPLIETIKKRQYKQALEHYKTIFGLLITNFSLGEECAIVTTQLKRPVTREKARFFKVSKCV